MTRDQEIVLFHYRLGVAMAEWSNVESAIGLIVQMCFKPERLNRESIGIGFFSLETTRARLNFADGVISRNLAGGEHQADWQKLLHRARTLSGQRNKLAHWPQRKFWDGKAGKRVVLIPWVYAKPTRKTAKETAPQGSLGTMDIFKIGTSFLELALDLQEFLHRALGIAEPNAKFPLLAGDHMTVAKLERQIREVFSVPLRPSRKKSESKGA